MNSFLDSDYDAGNVTLCICVSCALCYRTVKDTSTTKLSVRFIFLLGSLLLFLSDLGAITL